MAQVINTTSANLQKYKEEQIKAMTMLVAKTATKLELKATRQAPRGEDGEIFINIDKRFSDKGLTAEVGVLGENDLAAYFEFGTGLSAISILAPYPQWIKEIARKFYVNGQGTLTGKPYLYNNYLMMLPEFQRELDKIVTTETKDNG